MRPRFKLNVGRYSVKKNLNADFLILPIIIGMQYILQETEFHHHQNNINLKNQIP